jgi:hypothetical protein
MDLDGDQAQPQLGCDLLVDPPGDHELHDFALALRERAVAHLQLGQSRCVASPCAVAFDGRVDGVEQHLLVERLGEKVGRAGLHRAHRHRNVPVPRDEDDRQRDACLGQLLLKGESAHARQPHVEHEAARCVRPRGAHEFLGGGVEMHIESPPTGAGCPASAAWRNRRR